MTAASYRFGSFELQPDQRRLLRDGHLVTVGPRAFDVLLTLVDRDGQLVSKSQLLDLVWPNLVVEENNLQVQVSALRKVLGAHAITTIPGRGYRFTLGIEHTVPTLQSPLHPPRATNNLPHQISSFVGRKQTLAELKVLLSGSRLLTLVGVGGLGKTRLSLQLATEVMNDYRDGVWFVELAPLTDARRLPLTVATVLGVKEDPGRPILESLLEYVKGRALLLILDNCEHLLDPCAALAKQLLQSSAHLTVLATGREHLRVTGEITFPVPLLSVPTDNRLTLEACLEFEAVRLFSDRAIAAQPAFRITDRNAAIVTDICRRLDGIPLAIELAAARVQMLSVDEIAVRLNDRFRLLRHGDRASLPRQQTLGFMIDWSYDLLTERERVLLRRLAVFAGGWTLNAAEAVGEGGEISELDVSDLSGNLVEKSLVEFDMQGERYRLLETIRQYALERLQDSGEEVEVRARHLAFFVAFVERAQPKTRGVWERAWMSRLDLELENVAAAHGWCDGDGELGLRLVYALRHYWLHRGALELGYRMTVEVLVRVGAAQRNLVRCRALGAAVMLGSLMGRFEDVQTYVEESLSIARQVGDKDSVAVALVRLGQRAHAQGNLPAARGHLEASLAIALESSDKSTLASVLNALGELARSTGDLQAAQGFYERSLALAREQGDRYAIAVLLFNLAMVSIGRENNDGAHGLLLEVLAVLEEVDSKPLGRSAIELCAALATLRGKWERAAQLFGAADAQLTTMRRTREPADEAFLAPMMAKARDALGRAAFGEAENAGRSLSYEAALTEARAWLKDGS